MITILKYTNTEVSINIFYKITVLNIKNGGNLIGVVTTRVSSFGKVNTTIYTLLKFLNEKDLYMQNKEDLVGNGKAYLSAFRTNKEYQNNGYFSKLYKFMENDLKEKGYKILTLGVEPNEIRNMQIYFKWGFNKFIKTNYEYYPNEEKVIVNYYEKKL